MQFGIGERLLVSQALDKNVFEGITLPAVRDYLVRLEAKQQPTDFHLGLHQIKVDFTGKDVTARLLGPRHREGSPLLFTKVALGQLARFVLPSRFFSGLKQLSVLPQGGELTNKVWEKFAHRKTGKMVRVRTTAMKLGGEIHRVIRSCHSEEYIPYSNHEFVVDMLNNSADLSRLSVINWGVTDNGMYIRFAQLDQFLASFGQFDPKVVLKRPIPMVQVWNSETGCRSVGVHGGMWRFSSETGFGSWLTQAKIRQIHRGRPYKLSQRINGSLASILKAAESLVRDYEKAGSITVYDMKAWLATLFPQKEKQALLTRILPLLQHPTVTQGRNLARVVDAISLAAKVEVDLFKRFTVEQEAARVLRVGLALAAKNEGRIIEGDSK